MKKGRNIGVLHSTLQQVFGQGVFSTTERMKWPIFRRIVVVYHNEPQHAEQVGGSDEQRLGEKCHLGQMLRCEELLPERAPLSPRARITNLHYP
jgi:hypothetical protein